eukprot:CAMPEP_0194286706 /NCGR_PEP_ID=MMETSP0169-20130528/33095_1 /TAXON_ID=218684 /ORGANISM="Corethron pennatum, Strain L29A3" /LENGTH=92 /DNA_ID=CAMNT_0039033211 /DNA_START=20 /DNA_END=295 /DNA_ORIENTATION=+
MSLRKISEHGNKEGGAASAIRLLQWNILADGLGDDGFLSTEYSPIQEAGGDGAGYEASRFMALVRAAKQQDRAGGLVDKMGALKAAEKTAKK